MTTIFIRITDCILAFSGLIICSPLIIIVSILGFFDTGSPIFIQARVGRDRALFKLYKFRTMQKDTKELPTHTVAASAITPLGGFLRKTKLDELPQLINVLKGEMSLVGPRPCLPTQGALISARDENGIFGVRPGITGLAQINDIDMSSPHILVEWDKRMILESSLIMYFKCLLLTLMGFGAGDRVRKS